MRLAADRFLLNDRGGAIDLATGRRVEWRAAPFSASFDATRWLARCERLHALHHPAIARLMDFGVLPDGTWFEAWRCGDRWSGAPEEADRARRTADRFFRAHALTTGAPGLDAMHAEAGRAVCVPAADAGYDCPRPGGDGVTDRLPLEACGLASIKRPALTTLIEALGHPAGQVPRLLGLSGPPGSGKRAALAALARAARLVGYVPIASSITDEDILKPVGDRPVFLIVGSDIRQGWRRLLDLTITSGRSCVVLFVGRQPMVQVQTFELEAVPIETLVEAVRPEGLCQEDRHRVMSMARAAGGLPGHFADALRGICVTPQGPASSCPTGASERVEAFTSGDGLWEQASVIASTNQAVDCGEPWPEPGELEAIRRRVGTAVTRGERGRYASGERTLRQAVSFLMRRHDWCHAAEAAIALLDLRIRRGRLADVRAVLSDGQRCLRRAGEDNRWLRLGLLSGVAAVNDLQLDRAEVILRTVVSCGSHLGEPRAVTAGAVALARCLFWRGRYEEADQVLAGMDPTTFDTDEGLQADIERSRIALGRGDLALAGECAASAAAVAQRSGRPELVAKSSYASAFVHLHRGDHDAVAQNVEGCIRVARAVHDPVLALRARLLAVESERRQGRNGPAAALVRRVGSLKTRTPPIIGARLELLQGLLSGGPDADVARRLAARHRLPALALFAVSSPRVPAATVALDDVLRILEQCQGGQDADRTLLELCASLERRLRASAVAFLVHREGSEEMHYVCGGRVGPDVPKRIAAAGRTLCWTDPDGRAAGGAAAHFGGRTLGVLAARWPAGRQGDLTLAESLLTAASAAAAPVLAEWLAHSPASRPSGSELLGVSASIAEVRQAIERAGSAPYAVLVQGESGSGKELVARALHRAGPRRARTFCALNCAAIPDDLIESELFGHVRGAFSGAVADRVGAFEEAHAGTLFLDEVGELSFRAQAKLLRAIQEGEIRRVGENATRRADVRLVTATNRDLRAEVDAGRFRLDLLYRIDVLRIALPPLRERREDIAILADHFWRDACARVGSRAILGSAVLAALGRHDWPGNVRELQNVLAALAVRSPRRGLVPASALPPGLGEQVRSGWRLDEARRQFEERFIRAALARTGGHRGSAARDLGLTRQGLMKLMLRLGIQDASARSAASDR